MKEFFFCIIWYRKLVFGVDFVGVWVCGVLVGIFFLSCVFFYNWIFFLKVGFFCFSLEKKKCECRYDMKFCIDYFVCLLMFSWIMIFLMFNFLIIFNMYLRILSLVFSIVYLKLLYLFVCLFFYFFVGNRDEKEYIF